MDYIVNTPCGPVQGVAGRVPGTVAFKGIRYATAGRWEYPRQVTAWEGVYDASRYGACCYQPRSFYDEETYEKKYFYYHEFRKGMAYTYSEDCLFLNIFAPETVAEGEKLPVLFYIHGGGFTGGCAHEKHFDGPVWPARGVIGVTVNYRLGPLGFACLPELEEEAGHTGNYALYDQLCAMNWVRDNIASFGGDPENITIMGQSAGAMSVQQHCLSPLSKGKFRGAVMCSGGGVHKIMSAQPTENYFEFWRAVMKATGSENLAQFRAVAPEKLFEAWQSCKKTVKGGATATSPTLDSRFVVGTGVNVLSSGGQHQIPYMAGSTSHDMMPPILYGMSRDWCARQEKGWCWYFDRMLPGDDHGAWHSADLWYWFGTLENCWRPFEKKDYDLSEQMVSYLLNFCRAGDPNGAGLPAWQTCGKEALRLGEGDTAMGKPSTLKMFYTMLTNKAPGE